MKLSRALLLSAFAVGAVIPFLMRRRRPEYEDDFVDTQDVDRLNEKEDVDAYNADDMQPPFEEIFPRQSPMANG